MSAPRFFVGKHPCDDLPYVDQIDPDPRSGDPHFTFDGPDYSGWYVRQQALIPAVSSESIDVDLANKLLVEWGHYLGPSNRPFGQQAFALHIEGRPLAVAVSASMVSATATDDDRNVVARRGEAVELARLCAAEPWASRVMCRLWREVHARSWPYWPVEVAIAYSQNARHLGNIYRFDGWTKARTDAGSSGGGAWSRKRYASHAALGKKTLWYWRYP